MTDTLSLFDSAPREDAEMPWTQRVKSRFPQFCAHEFGERHVAFWEWREAITSERPRPFVALWPRGGAKSTSAEMFVCDAGLNLLRPYAVYISETQDQADKHVASIATMFERCGAGRAVNKYGASKGWRRNRLSVGNGFTVDSLGFDTAARGIKLDENRPGILVFDDIDSRHDSDRTIKKKIEILTATFLPAMAPNCVVLFMQNLIHRSSIATRLSNRAPEIKADFLVDRIVSGPFPAIDGLVTQVKYDHELGANRTIITEGSATWQGQSVAACQAAIDTYGLGAFMQESQHKVFEHNGALFNRDWFELVDEVPFDAQRIRRWDDAATENGGDYTAGVLMARAGNTYYVEHVVRFQHGPANRDKTMLYYAQRDYEKYGYKIAQIGVQDPGSAGVDRARSFKELMSGMLAITERETGDKVLRADGFSGEAGKKNVKLLRAPWNEPFLRELERFPVGEFDDQVDAAAGAYNRLARRRELRGAVG